MLTIFRAYMSFVWPHMKMGNVVHVYIPAKDGVCDLRLFSGARFALREISFRICTAWNIMAVAWMFLLIVDWLIRYFLEWIGYKDKAGAIGGVILGGHV